MDNSSIEGGVIELVYTRPITFHVLSFEIGAVSSITTLSPIWYSCFSSWALYLVWSLYLRLYFGCSLILSTFTTTVFCILSETTMPDNFFFDMKFLKFHRVPNALAFWCLVFIFFNNS